MTRFFDLAGMPIVWRYALTVIKIGFLSSAPLFLATATGSFWLNSVSTQTFRVLVVHQHAYERQYIHILFLPRTLIFVLIVSLEKFIDSH